MAAEVAAAPRARHSHTLGPGGGLGRRRRHYRGLPAAAIVAGSPSPAGRSSGTTSGIQGAKPGRARQRVEQPRRNDGDRSPIGTVNGLT
jgi:hypothetical protein